MDSNNFIVLSEAQVKQVQHVALYEPDARSRAKIMLERSGVPHTVVCIVDTIRNGEPVWDNSSDVKMQSTPTEPEYRVGEEVEVLRNGEWGPAEIAARSNFGYEYDTATDGLHSMSLSLAITHIRRPAPAVKAFEFGQRVRVGKDVANDDYSSCTAFFMGADSVDGELRVAVSGADCQYTYFKSDQVFPL